MECNKEDALKAKELAERKLLQRDLAGARVFAQKARDLYSNTDGLPQLLATIEVYVSAEKTVNGQVDWYGVLGVQPFDDQETIRRHYRSLALTLHPDKNKSIGADGAFNLISQAWSLLSDKTKRITYDHNYRSNGIYQGIPGRKPSVPASQNGYLNTLNTANRVGRGYMSALHPNPTQVSPVAQRVSFWTMCSFCRTQFEFEAVYSNCTVRCTYCLKPFLAFDEQLTPVHGNASSTSRVYQMREHGLNSTRMERNVNVSGRATMSAVNSSLVSGPSSMPGGISSGMTSASTAARAPGVFRMASENLKRKLEDSTIAMRKGAHFGKTHAVERTVAGSAFQSSCVFPNSVLKEDRPSKKRCLNGHKVDSGRKDAETNIASQNERINLANEFGSQKQSFDLGRVNVVGYHKRNAMKEESLQMRNSLMEIARNEIRKRLDEWSAASSVSKNLGKSKNSDEEVKKKDKEKAINVGEHGAQKVVNSDTVDKKCLFADSEVPISLSMSVPDPDFHDFDGDRIENTFGENQVWAAYDDDDGMPRYYAFVHDVISKNPFKVTISWLNSKTNDELAPIRWVKCGFPKTIGELRIGKREVSSTLNSFSHRVEWTKGSRGAVLIYPKKGDVWALYQNWSPDWNEFTKDEIIHKYEMVEVLEDYSEEQGLKVAPLVKVAGLKTVFRHNSEPRKIRNVPKEEMFRFSHRVPSYLLTGEEGDNAPRGCLELDPAATPMELLQVITVAQEQEMEMAIEKSLKDELRHIENSGENVKKKGNPETLRVYVRKRQREKMSL